MDLGGQEFMHDPLTELRGKLAGIPDAFLHISNWPGSTDPYSTNIDGRITSIQLVPEPTTVLAFGLILGAVASRARRRHP